MSYCRVQPVFNKLVRGLCLKPYPNHPHGCPNYGKKKTCPTQAPFLYDIVYLNKPIYAIWTIFDFQAHVQKMKRNHPNWSKRQLECCLYWQGTARKNLRKAIERFRQQHPSDNWVCLTTPEACGVDVTATMRLLGRRLQWPPTTKTYQVALAGRRKSG